MKIIAILAMDEYLLIGKRNALPWHLPEDLKRFREITAGWTVVMGKNTYFSLPEKFRPLPNRRNIIISREKIEGIETYASIESFLESLQSESIETVFLIGGASLYDQFFEHWLVDRVELTLVDGIHEGDIFVQEFRHAFEVVGETVSFPGGKWMTLEKK